MKRAQGDFGERPKRKRTDMTGANVRVLIPSKAAGALIGRGGETVKRLRSDFNADISIPDSLTPERIVLISAPDVQAVCDIILEVLAKLEEVCRNTSQEPELKVLVHQSQAGAIIGRAGAKIKELRDTTGTAIKCYSECCPRSTDRVVVIGGENEKVLSALREIMKILDEVPIKGPSRNYDTTYYEPDYADDYGGYPPERGAGSGGRGRGRGGSRGGGPGRSIGGGRFGGGGEMGGSGFGGRRLIGEDVADRFGAGDRFGGGGRFGGGDRFDGGDRFGGGGDRFGGGGDRFGGGGDRFGGGGDRFGGGGDPYDDFADRSFRPPVDDVGPASTQQVTIPKDLAGSILGKGGDRLNRIRQESGAKITLHEAEANSLERIISITGTPGRIQAAQDLLQQCVRASAAGRRYIHEAHR